MPLRHEQLDRAFFAAPTPTLIAPDVLPWPVPAGRPPPIVDFAPARPLRL